MPEYSTPKLTPAETSKLPGMNGSTSGYIQVDELLDIIRNTYGQNNGVATLGADGKLPTAQLPDIADDVLVYASKALLPAQGVEAKIYITTDDNVLYRWDATLGDYVQLSVDLSDYATLDDLAAEESARETADTNLNNALTALDHRVQNIEQSKGDYIVSSYKDGSTTPSGKGKWCVVEGVEGVSRVANQLVDPSNLRTREAYGVTITANADGTVTVVGMAEASTNLDFTLNNFGTVGHTYVVCGGKSNGSIVINDGSHVAIDSGAGALLLNSTGTVKLQFPITNGVTYNVTITPCVTDLNIYFNTTDLSFLGATDSAKLATIQKDYPHLLLPTEYGTRVIDWTGNGVRAWARNLVNPSTLTQDKYVDDGSGNLGNNTTFVASDFIDVIPTQSYYYTTDDSRGRWGAWYDENKVYISGISGIGVKVAPSNAKYARVTGCKDNYTTRLCFNISDSMDGTVTPYHAPNTLSFPSTTLKSAGSVREKKLLNVEVEIDGQKVQKSVKTNPLGEVDMGSMSWSYDSAGLRFYSTSISNLIKGAESTSVVGNLLCKKYVRASYNDTATVNLTVAVSTSGNIWIKDTAYTDAVAFKTAVTGIMLRYELATPNPDTYSDPIINNTLLTEAYGRLSTVQTGTVVDGISDLGFITL